ncbi:MAG: class II aldolase/adducin family protein [Paracoccaceae bacterium]|nr:class II aldolase/adducin family protein [Paracoccaceae bacterium]
MPDLHCRQDIIAAYRRLEAKGLNRGASGNISVRSGADMLITPTAVAHDAIEPAMIARMALSDDDGDWQGPKPPSSEWRFHRAILNNRPDINAVVHTHAPYCTILAIARKPIPAIHYMIAAFGGPDIRVADYARYGTAELAAHVEKAMAGRAACLMANHGMVVGGHDLVRAMWLVDELEALAHHYYHSLAIGGGHILTDAQIAETAAAFSGYGVGARPGLVK